MTAGTPVQVLRAAEQAARPWKNGGGVTRELAAHPSGSDLDSFDWRISIATVHAAGPFSRFAGIRRHMAVLEGRLSLEIAGAPAALLTADAPPLVFEGEASVTAAPLGGTVTDLNVMVRRARWQAHLARRLAGQPVELAPAVGVRVLVPLAPLQFCSGAFSTQLGRYDAVMLDAGEPCRVPAAAAQYYLALLSPAA